MTNRLPRSIAVLTLVALALRLFRINAQSAWIDEAFTIHAAAGGWDEMMRILVGDFNHPPLHTMLVSWTFDLFGVGVIQARALSAIFGTLAVPALYWLGCLLFDRRTALLGSVLLAISQLGIIYSQEARAYSLLLLLVILATCFFVRAFQRRSPRDFALFVLTTSVMSYTHYYAVFPVLAMAAFAVVFRRRSAIPALWWVAFVVVTVVAYVPWLTSGVIQSALRNPGSAVVEGAVARLATPIYALNWFNSGKVAGIRDAAPLWAFALGFVLITGPVVYALRRFSRSDERERQSVVLLLLTAVVPVIAVWCLGFLHVVYDVRHVSFVIAPYYLLVARGVTLVTSAQLRLLLTAALVGYTTLSFRADYFVPYKEEYRDALHLVDAQSKAGDCTIFAAPDRNSFARLYWDSYHHPQEPPGLVTLDQASSRPECRRAWVVWDKNFWKSGTMTYADVQAALAPAFTPGTQWTFLGVDVQLFEGRR